MIEVRDAAEDLFNAMQTDRGLLMSMAEISQGRHVQANEGENPNAIRLTAKAEALDEAIAILGEHLAAGKPRTDDEAYKAIIEFYVAKASGHGIADPMQLRGMKEGNEHVLYRVRNARG